MKVVVGAALLISAAAGMSHAADGRKYRDGPAFDVNQAVYDHFDGRMDPGWFIGPPRYNDRRIEIVINIPGDWRGNPTASLLAVCPERDDRLWTVVDTIVLAPYWRDLPWAEVVCWQ